MGKKFIYSIVIATLLLLIVLVVAVRPVEKLYANEASEEPLANHFWASMDHISFEITNGGMYVEQRLPVANVSEMLQFIETDDLDLTEMSVSIEDGMFKVVENDKLLAFIPTQYTLYYTPSVKDGRIKLTLQEANIGRLPLSKGLVASQLENAEMNLFQVDELDRDSLLFVGTPRSFLFDTARIEKEEFVVGFHVKIESLFDVLELANFMMPEQLIQVLKEKIL